MSLVSIILPTFNRASFLPEAFASLNKQLYREWELIIVDDGSTDDTQNVLRDLISSYSFNVQVIKQSNAGPAVARNTGIKKATGQFIAFFDSDDTWSEDHLITAVNIFDKHEYIDWLYFSCRRLEYSTKNVILNSTFYHHDKTPNRLFDCATCIDENLFVLQNKSAALCQINYGIDSGLQNSVFRAVIFKQHLLPDFRIGEDRIFILQLLKAGYVAAFMDKITVNYMVHENNSSDTNINEEDFSKRIDAMNNLLNSYKATFSLVNLEFSEKKALKKRLAEDYFWKLGYSLELQAGLKNAALSSMWQGIKYHPLKLKYWKTFVITFFKCILKI